MSEPSEYEMLLEDEKLLMQQVAEIQEVLHKLQYELCIVRDALRKYEHLTVIHKKTNENK